MGGREKEREQESSPETSSIACQWQPCDILFFFCISVFFVFVFPFSGFGAIGGLDAWLGSLLDDLKQQKQQQQSPCLAILRKGENASRAKPSFSSEVLDPSQSSPLQSPAEGSIRDCRSSHPLSASSDRRGLELPALQSEPGEQVCLSFIFLSVCLSFFFSFHHFQHRLSPGFVVH